MFGRRRKAAAAASNGTAEERDVGVSNSTDNPPEKSAQNPPEHHHHLHVPVFNHNGHKVTKGIHPDGESGRAWIHPWHFVRICARSSCDLSLAVNVLWPFVPAAIAIHFARPNDDSTALHLWRFSLNYIAMVPTANLIGFAGQELARKLPKVIGVLLETFLGGLVEIVLFITLIAKSAKIDPSSDVPAEERGKDLVPVIKSAILGSILANLLLCLGFCFFVGGLRRDEQEFHEVISEVGNGLMLVAGFGLLIPTAFAVSLASLGAEAPSSEAIYNNVIHISRITSIILLIAFCIYVWFQLRTHHGIYDEVLEADEQKDHDRERDLKKDKLTFTECIIALVIALTCVSLHAVFLVEEIDFIVERRGVSEAFMGLILVPLVEKVAEHLTAVDEAWDNQMNFALAHVIGATIQTALFNSSLVVIVGWGLGKAMDLQFEIYHIVVLIMAIIVVGNFLRDQKSNYLEGSMCILIYILIAIASWYYLKPVGTESGAESDVPEANSTEPSTEAAERMLRYALRS